MELWFTIAGLVCWHMKVLAAFANGTPATRHLAQLLVQIVFSCMGNPHRMAEGDLLPRQEQQERRTERGDLHKQARRD